MITKEYCNYLAHHGIIGQRWGKRRFQNEDGSLTPEGKLRYSNKLQKDIAGSFKNQVKIHNKTAKINNPKLHEINAKYSSEQIDVMRNHPTKADLDYVREVNKSWKHDYETVAYDMFGKDNPMWDKKILDLSFGYNDYQELEDDIINRRKGKPSIYAGTHD